MPLHIRSHYRDGFNIVAYCIVCGKEEPEINGTECEGKFNSEKIEKSVDKKDKQD